MSRRAESAAGRVSNAGSLPGLTVVAYVVLLTLLNEVGALPLAFYSGYLMERRYGLSNETVAGWALDQMKSLAVGLLLGGGAAALIYFLIRLSPERWWICGLWRARWLMVPRISDM